MNLCRCPADLFWLPEVYSEIVWHADYYCNFCYPNNTGLKIFELAFRSDFWQL
jgi:hypothetical protein